MLRRILNYFQRPDIRQHPARFLWRKLVIEALRRTAPSRLRREDLLKVEPGLVMALHRDEVIERAIYLYGRHEFVSAGLFERLVRSGDTVIDVGAHVGEFSLLAAKRCGLHGTVIAFEPNPLMRQRLERNVGLNNLTNIQVWPMALSNFEGEASLYVPAGNNQGLASLKRPMIHALEHRIECVRLDVFLERNATTSVDVMKIDVEGAEAEVLEGASMTLERSHPAILLEVGETGVDPARRRSLELLLAEGYIIHGISHTYRAGFRLVPLEDLDHAAKFREPFRALNVVALHPQRENGQELVET